MSEKEKSKSAIPKVALGAVGGAIGSGLVSVIPNVPTVAVALTFVGIFGIAIYEALKDHFQ